MYSWRNYQDKVKRYFKFSNREWLHILVTTLVSAFILSFTDWGVNTFDISIGLLNLFNTFLIVIVVVMIQESVHRLVALLAGYKVEYRMWWPGLLVGFVVIFFSNGAIKLLAPGGIVITHLALHRIGRFRYGPNYNTIGWIAMTGPLSNIFLAIVFKALSGVATNAPLFEKAMSICILFAIFNMLPIPPLNGHQLFFGSRYIYIGVLGAIIACASALYFLGVIGTILSALIFGAIAITLYFVFVDKMFK